MKRWVMTIVSALIAAGLNPHSVSGQVTQTLVSQKDNTLYYNATGSVSNGLGIHMIAGRTAGFFLTNPEPRRALVWFNVAAFIPSGATIVNADLVLTLNRANPGSGNQPVTIHRMNPNAYWGEGNSNAGSLRPGTGAASAPGDATWLHRVFPDTLWSDIGATIGADGAYDAAASATAIVPVAPGSVTWTSTAAMVADVQFWLDNPLSNNGWIIKGNEATPTTTKRFYTKDDGSPSNRPQLVVDYLPPVAVGDDAGTIPKVFELKQNYPNPFNPSTSIEYVLEQPLAVRLDVYNVGGQHVRTIDAGAKPAGRHRVRWDGTNALGQPVASGVYLYALNAGPHAVTRKMVLIR